MKKLDGDAAQMRLRLDETAKKNKWKRGEVLRRKAKEQLERERVQSLADREAAQARLWVLQQQNSAKNGRTSALIRQQEQRGLHTKAQMDQMQQVLNQLEKEQHRLDDALLDTVEDIEQDLVNLGEGNWNPVVNKRKSPPKKGSSAHHSHHQPQREDLNKYTDFNPASTTMAKSVVVALSAAITLRLKIYNLFKPVCRLLITPGPKQLRRLTCPTRAPRGCCLSLVGLAAVGSEDPGHSRVLRPDWAVPRGPETGVVSPWLA